MSGQGVQFQQETGGKSQYPVFVGRCRKKGQHDCCCEQEADSTLQVKLAAASIAIHLLKEELKDSRRQHRLEFIIIWGTLIISWMLKN